MLLDGSDKQIPSTSNESLQTHEPLLVLVPIRCRELNLDFVCCCKVLGLDGADEAQYLLIRCIRQVAHLQLRVEFLKPLCNVVTLLHIAVLLGNHFQEIAQCASDLTDLMGWHWLSHNKRCCRSLLHSCISGRRTGCCREFGLCLCWNGPGHRETLNNIGRCTLWCCRCHARGPLAVLQQLLVEEPEGHPCPYLRLAQACYHILPGHPELRACQGLVPCQDLVPYQDFDIHQ